MAQCQRRILRIKNTYSIPATISHNFLIYLSSLSSEHKVSKQVQSEAWNYCVISAPTFWNCLPLVQNPSD